MKYLKTFNEEGGHVDYYNDDSTNYPNVGAYRENVLTSSEYDRVQFRSEE